MTQLSKPRSPSGERLLSVHDVAELLGYSVQSIWRLEKDGLIPSKVSFAGGRVVWFEEHITAWLDEQKAFAEKHRAEKIKKASAEKLQISSLG